MDSIISQQTLRHHDDYACTRIDSVTQDLLRTIEQASLLAEEMGRDELGTSLRGQGREIAQILRLLQDNCSRGSECWWG